MKTMIKFPFLPRNTAFFLIPCLLVFGGIALIGNSVFAFVTNKISGNEVLNGDELVDMAVTTAGEVVYVLNGNSQTRAYVTSMGGNSAPQLLSDNLFAFSRSAFLLSPDEKYIVYATDANPNNLFAVSLAGGDPIPLTENGVAFDFNGNFFFELLKFSEDGRYLIYSGLDTRGIYGLYRVSFETETLWNIEQVVELGGNDDEPSGFESSPDGQRILYSIFSKGYFVVPADGGTAAAVFERRGDDFLGRQASFSADGQRVVVQTYENFNRGGGEIYTVPADGGTKAAVENVTDGHLYPYVMTPNRERIVYFKWLGPSGPGYIYTADVNGGGPSILAGPIPFIDLFSGDGVPEIAISPDGQYVVFSTFQETYAVPISGGTVVELAGPNQTAQGSRPVISPDSLHVVLRGSDQTPFEANSTQLYSVPITGGSLTQLSSGLQLPAMLDSEISADSGTLFYRANDGSRWQLFSVPLTGGQTTAISGLQFSASTIENEGEYRISVSGTAVFWSNEEDLGKFELFATGEDRGPIFLSQPSLTGFVDSLYTYEIIAEDPDQGPVVIGPLVKPDWLTLVDNGDGTATLFGTPRAADIGVHKVEIAALDGEGLVRSQSFEITVLGENRSIYIPLYLR
ncbi:MAG: hypothetical protein AAF633_00525 [Chloroflexota bacterium]